jgi:hypothetical protein
MKENQDYLLKSSPSYFRIENDQIVHLPISFPLKPIFFERNEMFENIFYQKFRERIPYDYILLFGISPPHNYLEIPFYFFSFHQDFYSSHPNHPFYGLWYSFIHNNDVGKFPWYDIGKICEESIEIWIHSSQILHIDLLMRLPLRNHIYKIFYQHLNEKEKIQQIYSKSIIFQFIEL